MADIAEGNFESFIQAYKYYRTMFEPLTIDRIDEFLKKYRHSKEEEEDLIDFYNRLDNKKKRRYEIAIGIYTRSPKRRQREIY